MPIEVARTGDLDEAIAFEAPRPDALGVLPLRDLVAYPDTLTPLAIGQERSMRLINDIMSGERQLVLVAARDPEPEEPAPDGLYTVGVAGIVARMLRVPGRHDPRRRAGDRAGPHHRLGRRGAVPGGKDRVLGGRGV